jgi:uracil-DNA glycosylase family 4
MATYYKKRERIEYQPLDPQAVPKTVNVTRKTEGNLVFSSTACDEPGGVMILAPYPTEEDANPEMGTPVLMRNMMGSMIKRAATYAGIPSSKIFFTPVIRWVVPRGYKIKTDDVDACRPALMSDIAKYKPSVILCLGKLPFHTLFRKNFKYDSALGGWFDGDNGERLLAGHEPFSLIKKPEKMEAFIVDFKEIGQFLGSTRSSGNFEQDYRVVENSRELEQTGNDIINECVNKLVAVDMESGQSPIFNQGFLRSLQMSWLPGKAAYVKFFDENQNYVFDVSQKEAGKIISRWWNHPGLKLMGHQLCTDLVWSHYHLGLPYYGRSGWDTLFAEHAINENSDLKLERLSMKYTSLGRYDIDLLLWKVDNPIDKDKGYETIPDDILIPYGMKDVDCLQRIQPHQKLTLAREKTIGHFLNSILPFSTDVFSHMMFNGIPVNVEYLEELRDTFEMAEEFSMLEFKESLKLEALSMLFKRLITDFGKAGVEWYQMFRMSWENCNEPNAELIKNAVGEKWTGYVPLMLHCANISNFKIGSHAQMSNWLFKVKALRPVKTTKGKHGFSMAWDKVEELPPSRRSEYTPAVDKNSLKVFAQTDPVVDKLLEYNSVRNIAKGFLKQADETGREHGIRKWVSDVDHALHSNFNLTDTTRCRSWNPNILNLNKKLAKYIEKAIERMNKTLDTPRKVTGVRQIAHARSGFCFWDCDYQTAEVVALAYLSGDMEMVQTVSEPDVNFVMAKPPGALKAIPVRVSYGENEPYDEKWKNDEFIVTSDFLEQYGLRNEKGGWVHPRRDIHWEVAESNASKPRELLDPDVDRDGAKVTNFSAPYGATGAAIERQIEVITGRKPEPGTGDKLLEARALRYKVADAYLKALEFVPESPGYYRSISGRLRHFQYDLLEDVNGISDYNRKAILNPLIRKARNFPIQEIVAATMMKGQNAFLKLLETFPDILQGVTMPISLYDAILVSNPLHKRLLVKELIRCCFSEHPVWDTPGGKLQFGLDMDTSFVWGGKPTSDQVKLLDETVSQAQEFKEKYLCQIPYESLLLS